MNNFDSSSTGISIDMRVIWDNDISQVYFDEWLTDGVEKAADDVYIIDGGKPMFKKWRLNRKTYQELEDLSCDLDVHTGYEEFKADHIENLLEVTITDYYKTISLWRNTEKIEHPCIISHGYCQGDAVIIINGDGSKFTKRDKTSYDNLFWNSPVYARAEVTENNKTVEVYLDHELSNSYEWNQQEVIEKAINSNDELSEKAKKALIEMLPSEPNYE